MASLGTHFERKADSLADVEKRIALRQAFLHHGLEGGANAAFNCLVKLALLREGPYIPDGEGFPRANLLEVRAFMRKHGLDDSHVTPEQIAVFRAVENIKPQLPRIFRRLERHPSILEPVERFLEDFPDARTTLLERQIDAIQFSRARGVEIIDFGAPALLEAREEPEEFEEHVANRRMEISGDAIRQRLREYENPEYLPHYASLLPYLPDGHALYPTLFTLSSHTDPQGFIHHQGLTEALKDAHREILRQLGSQRIREKARLELSIEAREKEDDAFRAYAREQFRKARYGWVLKRSLDPRVADALAHLVAPPNDVNSFRLAVYQRRRLRRNHY